MLIDIYTDIETVRTANPSLIAQLKAGVTPPGNISKPETIAKWNAESRPAAEAEIVDRTALDGAHGRCAVIGWAIGDDEPRAYTAVDDYSQGDENTFAGEFDETSLIQAYFEDVSSLVGDNRVRIVGHNISGFDVKFLTQRAIVLGIRLPIWWPVNAKPWDERLFDTMVAWAGTHDRASLDKLCCALDIPGKSGFTGADVGVAWDLGEYAKVASYCADDVRRSRAVAKRFFAVLPA